LKHITPPHPTLLLITMILGLINLMLFLPDKYNYFNWVGWLWTGFWWCWFFPFFAIKIYDWSHVRSLRKNGGGGNPMLRLLGFMIVAMVIGILVLILILNVISWLLSGGKL